MSTRRCFVSYHHDLDEDYAIALRDWLSGTTVMDYSLKDDISHLTDEGIYQTIRKKMRRCSVTVVLIGESTGSRKWIDWELWASLREYNNATDPLRSFRANGLLGIFLPTVSHDIPDRFRDNIESRFAVSMKWENVERDFYKKIDYAYWKRTHNRYQISNSRIRQLSDY